MTPGRLAAVLAVVAGLLLAAGGVLTLLNGSETSSHQTLAKVGYGVAVAALVCLGYSLVPKAPVWLRLISSAGMALLVSATWEAIAEWVRSSVDGSKGHALAHLAAGLLLLVAAAVGWSRSPRVVHEPTRTHRH